MKTLTVVAQMKAKPGQEKVVREVLLSLVAPTREEAGCLNYDLHQSTETPGLFLFHENWSSKGHLEKHLQTPHLQSALAQIVGLLAEPAQITLLERIG